jgi:hypothetical protein
MLNSDGNTWDLIECKSDEDYDSAIIFLNHEYKKNNGEKWTRESFKWKNSHANPAGNGVTFCAKLNEKTIGILSLTLKILHYRGEDLLVGELGDGYTSKEIYTKKPVRHLKCNKPYTGIQNNSEYIKNSIAGRLCAEIINWANRNSVEAIYGTPNDIAIRSWINRMDFVLVNEEKCVKKRIFITKKLIQTTFKVNPIIASLLANTFSILNLIFLFISHFKIKKYTIEEIKNNFILDEFDDLWNRYKKKRVNEIVRDKKWIKWRYKCDDEKSYKIFTLKNSNVLVGWCIVCVKESLDLRKITICDALHTVDDRLWSAFILNVMKKIDYQDAIVTYWIAEKSNNNFFNTSLFSYAYGNIDIIFKRTCSNNNLFEKIDFDEFFIGHSDNI